MRKLTTFVSVCTALAFAKNPCTPSQVHLSLSDAYTNSPAENSSSMRVVFHTSDRCDGASIALNLGHSNVTVKATSFEQYHATYDNSTYSTVAHVFDLPHLEVGKVYEYSCYGDAANTEHTGPFKFYAPDPKPNGNPTTVVMFGDSDSSPFGMITTNKLHDIVNKQMTKVDAFIHMGDIAYDLENDAGLRGDKHMDVIQPIAASMPYMIFAGNHENRDNFTNFNMRFKMPNYHNTQNALYSYNLGNIHFVHFNIEALVLHKELIHSYVQWIKNDLKEANADRAERPWIVVSSHRPIYCSKKDDEDCDNNPTTFKHIEEALLEAKVDLYISGHVHYYERMLPIEYGNVAKYESAEHDVNHNYIKNAQAPIYILQGIAGHNNYQNHKKIHKGKHFSAHIDTTYSYNVVKAFNSTHLLVENVYSENDQVGDYVYLIKDHHGAPKSFLA